MSVRIVLHVEDNPDDAFFVKRAVQHSGLALKLLQVRDGKAAMDMLQLAQEDSPETPHILLLDLKLPGFSGFDILAWVRKHPRWTKLPVAILTSSELSEDIAKANELGPVSYLVKSPKCENVIAFLREILSKIT